MFKCKLDFKSNRQCRNISLLVGGGGVTGITLCNLFTLAEEVLAVYLSMSSGVMMPL
jgi:hypothetical protein